MCPEPLGKGENQLKHELCNKAILQSGVVGKDVEAAVILSGLRRTLTPCMLLIKVLYEDPDGNMMLKIILSKIINLQERERNTSFELLLALFFIGYEKRLNKGVDNEKYWWYRDLSDEEVVKKILINGACP